ncbi:MAG: ASKHA domain-containing protein [Desulfobacterales bacterium]|nr:ASKHA domain-containing protein [Desulfobacterales bacterium]
MKDNRNNPSDADGVRIDIQAGETLPQATARHGLSIRKDCGDKGVCGQCRIRVDDARDATPLTDAEQQHLDSGEIERGFRLACQVRLSSPARLWIPSAALDTADVHGKESFACQLEADPMVARLFLERSAVPLVMEGKTLSLTGWLAERVREETGVHLRLRHHRILSALSAPEAASQAMTLVNHAQQGVTAIWPGRRPASYGLAFDIGTTTLAAYLCDLVTGEVRASASAVNPQRTVGEDVISRIAHCSQETEGLDQLRGLVVEGMNGLIRNCLASAGLKADAVDEVVVVGNPTMEQILAGFHPHAIGVAPYLPLTSHIPDLTAEELGLDLYPATAVYFFPVVSGFIGGDTLGAVLADGLFHGEKTALLVDIGTNGEIVMGNKDALWATSCATGPALEGAQLSCGMRAAAGAIDRVFREPGGTIGYHVLGKNGTRPKGICGSGIVDALATLRQAGGLDPSGRLNPDFPGVETDDNGVGHKFVLVRASENASGGEIAVTLKDIRQFQLAKAALAVGIAFLMDRVGVDGVSRTVLTGAFGARFNWRSAVVTGMLPAVVVRNGVAPKLNLAGVGAVMGLVNRCHRDRALEIQDQIRFVEMAGDPSFIERFTAATAFPDLNTLTDLLDA